MSRILVVDDERSLREVVTRLLRKAGHFVDEAETGDQAVAAHQADRYDLLILDVALPDKSGIDVLRAIRQFDTAAVAVFITAHGSIRSAVEAIHAGGYDYLTKPFDNDVLLLTVGRALERFSLGRQVERLSEDLSAVTNAPGIVGKSEAIREVVRVLTRVARTDASVLLVGESGTGKELAAKAIHRQSPRATAPLVPLNCGTIPTTLAGSVLFGHERGAFTDARTTRRGQFELADGGTLFLDEVGEIPLDVQPQLLRALQEGEVVRLGADRPISVNVRVVAATNRDLLGDVEAGRFREDLYWRLNVVQLKMPPLRARIEDVPLLVDFLLTRVNAECRTAIVRVSDDVLEQFSGYRWPGNVRELTNVLRHGAVMAESDVIEPADLPTYLTEAPRKVLDADDPLSGVTLEEAMAATERRLVEATLRRFEGNRKAAAAALGIDRRTLYNKIETHGLRDQAGDAGTRRR